MTRLFLKIYDYFKSHKGVMYTLLVLSTLLFGFFAFKIQFKENILDLLPKTDKAKASSVAFGDVKLKDKIMLEIVPEDGTTLPVDSLVAAMDDYMSILETRDSAAHYIDATFYKLDTDDLMNLISYGQDALPCHLGEWFYEAADTLLTDKGIDDIASGKLPAGLSAPGSYTFLKGHLFSPDSTVAIAVINPSFPGIETLPAGELEKEISASRDEFLETHPSMDVLYHGTTIEGCFNSRQIKTDLAFTVGISLLLICFILCFCLRSRGTLPQVLMPIIYGTLCGLAGVYWIKGSMSLIAIGIGALILGVAMSYCLHVIVHHKYVSDVRTVLAEQARPVCLGCLTTIGAFAGLLLTTSELLSDFGIFASLMLVGTTLFALIFLPHFFSDDDARRSERAFKFINKVNAYPLDRNKPVVIIMVLICIVCIIASRKVGFDSDLVNIGYKRPAMLKSVALYDEKVNGNAQSVYFASHADNLDSAIVYSRRMQPVLDSLKAAGKVSAASGVDGILVTQSEQEENIKRWKAYWTPERTSRVYNLLKRKAQQYDWEDKTGMDIPEEFKLLAEADFEPHNIYDECDDYSFNRCLMSSFVEHNEDGWMVFTNVLASPENMEEVKDDLAKIDHIVVLNPFYYTGDMVEIVHDDFNKVLGVSSVFVFIVLLLSFRNLLISLIAFLPMLLSWYIVQGIMAIFGIQFNLLNIMISTFVFGIGVDYSIFVMEGLINKRRYKSHRLLTCHKAAIFFSAVALIIVTASLLFATHPAIYSIGIATLIGMTSTILITYALQPMLFRLVMKKNENKDSNDSVGSVPGNKPSGSKQ